MTSTAADPIEAEMIESLGYIRSGIPNCLIISDVPEMTIPWTWKCQVIRLPAMMPMTIPVIVIVMDSIRRSFESRSGVVPIAIRTPNSLVRSNTAMRKVFRMLKATTIIKMR